MDCFCANLLSSFQHPDIAESDNVDSCSVSID